MFFTTICHSRTISVACLTAALLAACGVSDRKVNEGAAGDTSNGGSSGADAEGGRAGKGQGATTGGGIGKAGGTGETGDAGAAGSGPPPGCTNNALRCTDNATPAKCVDGVWIDQNACSASKPICSNGVCAATTLAGGVVTVSNATLSNATVRLVEHGLEYSRATCGTVGTQKVCVTGGIRP